MIFSAPLLLLAVIVLAGFLIGRAVHKDPRRLMAFSAAGAIGIFVVLAMLLTQRSSHSTVQERVGHYPAAVTAEEPSPHRPTWLTPEAKVPAQEHAWQASDLVPFKADLYPSKVSSLRAIIRRELPKSLARILPANETLGKVWVSVQSDSELEADAISAVGGALSEANISLSSISMLPPDRAASPFRAGVNEIHIGVEVLQPATTQPAAAPDGEPADGVLQVTLQGENGTVTHTASFTHAPWCEDFHRWQQTQQAGSSPRTWILATSEALSPTVEEARQQARAQAGSKLAARVLQYIPTLPDSGNTRMFNRLSHRTGWVKATADQWVNNGTLKTRSFDQQFNRPYGTLWRSALLIEAPERELKAMAQMYVEHARSQSQSWAKLAISAVALLGVILLVYLFLNAATKGYYVWSVRIGTVVLAAVGVSCILLLA